MMNKNGPCEWNDYTKANVNTTTKPINWSIAVFVMSRHKFRRSSISISRSNSNFYQKNLKKVFYSTHLNGLGSMNLFKRSLLMELIWKSSYYALVLDAGRHSPPRPLYTR